MYPTIRVKKGREESLERFHPWLFSGAIERAEGTPAVGDIVRVISHSGAVLGYGHYGSATIAVKMLTFGASAPDTDFFRAAMGSAVNLRRNLGLLDSQSTNAFRLVHAEGDGLPGLIIDLLGTSAVIEFHSKGMFQQRAVVVELLRELLGKRVSAVWSRTDPQIDGPGTKDLKAESELLWNDGGDSNPEFEIFENGRRFIVDVAAGQKTGFFTDQRENRELVSRYATGRDVLDCFCYSGGFGSYAGSSKARSITFVDSSKPALELARRNIGANAPGCAVQEICADALQYLKELPDSFDLIVLDPPAFVKHRGALTGGCKGYESVNYHGISKVRPGGFVATFSCSQLVGPELFRRVVFKSAQKSGRRVRVLHEFRQSPCHPTSIYHPEGEYLKGLFLAVE